MYMVLRFVVYGAIGWITEVLWTGMGSLLAGDPRLRSYTYLWMFPIYGGAVFLEVVHDNIRNWNWFARGLLYMVLCGLLQAWHLKKSMIFSISGWYLCNTAPISI